MWPVLDQLFCISRRCQPAEALLRSLLVVFVMRGTDHDAGGRRPIVVTAALLNVGQKSQHLVGRGRPLAQRGRFGQWVGGFQFGVLSIVGNRQPDLVQLRPVFHVEFPGQVFQGLTQERPVVPVIFVGGVDHVADGVHRPGR